MARHVVSKAADIPVGGNKVVAVRGREIAVFNVGGEFFAILNRCPHEGASLARGACVGLIQSDEPGRFSYSRAGEFVRCPWHGWEYDLRTGQSWCDPGDIKVKTYVTSVEPGENLVKGPYVVDTFPVSIEEDYVVVDV